MCTWRPRPRFLGVILARDALGIFEHFLACFAGFFCHLSKHLSVSRLFRECRKQEDARGASEVRRGIFHCLAAPPGCPIILGMEHWETRFLSSVGTGRGRGCALPMSVPNPSPIPPPREKITKIIRPEYFYVIFGGDYSKTM